MHQDSSNLQKNSSTSLSMVLQLWNFLSRKRKNQFVFLFILTVFSALFEVISIGAVIPFLGVLISPEKVFSYPFVTEIAAISGIEMAHQLALPLTIIFSIAALVAGSVRMLLLWLSTRLSYASGVDLSLQMYKRTLYQPYRVHVSRNSSEVITGISNKVGTAIAALYQVNTLISSIILILFVISALIIVNPYIAIGSVIAFGTGYRIISLFTRHRLKANSQCIARESTKVIRAIQEGLGGIRDVLLDGTQKIYFDIYKKADLPYRRALGNNTFLAISPRYAMEVVGMIVIAVMAYLVNLQSDGFAAMLPVFAAIALGAQRLLPAVQQIYNAWANIIGIQDSLQDVLTLLEQPLPQNIDQSNDLKMDFYKFQFTSVFFKYNKSDLWVLSNVDLTINKGERVGLVGSTGSGKSTALDLLMGLLLPSKGNILINGEPLCDKNIRAWQKIIAHVPQSIFLSDNSIAENIAFGIPLQDIDMDRVKFVAKMAHIAEFIESKQNGYLELVGERGVRLSGGQKQRIGIARALYKNATVLVFDEATSALDNVTENSIMQAIGSLSRDLTIILIAHRLSTVRYCDVIYEFDKGKVISSGTYEELLEISPSFKKMASAV